MYNEHVIWYSVITINVDFFLHYIAILVEHVILKYL